MPSVLLQLLPTLAVRFLSVSASSISLDLGWRFKLGNIAAELLSCEPGAVNAWDEDVSLDGMTCPGWPRLGVGDGWKTEEECALYCCSEPSCRGYLYTPTEPGSNSYATCLIGDTPAASSCHTSGLTSLSTKGRTRASVPATIPQPGSSGPIAVDFDDSAWRLVDVPHDFVVESNPTPGDLTKPPEFRQEGVQHDWSHGYRPKNISWYRKHLSVSDRLMGKVVWLQFDGAFRASDVWLNGKLLGHHSSGYTGFHYRADQVLRSDGDNVIAVRIDPRANEGWWYEGGTSLTRITAGTTQTLHQEVTLPSATLWDAELAPALYTLLTELVSGDGQAVLHDSSRETRFGIRKMEFDPDAGLILNDRSIKVRGMCNHHDFAGVGAALPDGLNRFRLELMRDWGVNAWRMSHNPPAPELLDMTDELGVLVLDEIRHFGDLELWRTEARETVLRDRNHPSIMMYSLCNEWGCQPAQDDDQLVLATGIAFRSIIKQLDPSRALTSAWDWHAPNITDAWATNVTDVFGINYNDNKFDGMHAKHPHLPIISTENCNAKTDRTWVANASEAIIALDSRDNWPGVSGCWGNVRDRSFVMGSFTWTGFDYRGEEVPTVWPSTNSHFGMIDLAGFPKDQAYWWRAQFLPDEPLAHLTAVVVDDTHADVTVYTTGDAVELLVNGVLAARLPGLSVYGRAFFPQVAASIAPGTNFTAVAYRDAVRWAVQSLVMASRAAALRLHLDWPRADSSLVADGQDVALLAASIVDEEGRLVRSPHKSGHLLHFAVVEGDATVIGTGNGDPSDEFDATGGSCREWSGYARAILRMGMAAGQVRVVVTADGLTQGSLTFHTGKVSSEESQTLLV